MVYANMKRAGGWEKEEQRTEKGGDVGRLRREEGKGLGKLYSLMISLTGGIFSPAPNARRHNDENNSLVCSMLPHT